MPVTTLPPAATPILPAGRAPRPAAAAGRGLLLAALVLLAALPAAAQQAFVDPARTIAVDRSRGVDSRVDYAALLALGPWDDRNYELTLEDLAVLPPGERDQHVAIPAFYRVRLRQAVPETPRTGEAQYPRHTLHRFRAAYGGYLVDGRLYREVAWNGSRFEVVLRNGIAEESFAPGADALAGEVRLTSPTGAAESAIKFHPTDPSKVIAGTNGPGAGQGMWWSTDGGSSWTRVNLPLGNTAGDPSVDWSANGAFAYTTTLASCFFTGCQVYFYRSADGGQTWNSLETVTPGDPRREFGNGVDKEYLHVDKAAGSPFRGRIYVAWHESNVQKWARSADQGNTFTTGTFPGTSEELGIGSDITSGTNGHVYYLWPGVNSRTIRMRKSTDGGVTWSATSTIVANTQGSYDFPLPSMESRRTFIYVAADADTGSGPFAGSIYAAWTDNVNADSPTPSQNHGRVQVARSRDNGATWQVSTPHETADQLTVDRYHPWLAVGQDGTVHVIYYDTRRDPSRNSVDIYYAKSSDGAVTWSAPQRLTSVASVNIADGFEWGDYNGLDVIGQSLIAVFTDNRNETGGGTDSVDVYGAAAPAAGGAGAGAVPDGKVVPGLPLQVTRAGAGLTLDWDTACGAASDYAAYEGELGLPGSAVPKACSSGGATELAVTPAEGNRFYLVVPLAGGREGSYGRTSAGVERAPSATPCAPQQLAGCP